METQLQHITRVVRDLEGLGITAPKALARPAELTAALGQALTPDPAAELADRITSGALKPAEAGKALLDAGYTLAALDKAREVRLSLTRVLNQQTARALRDSGDEIIEALRAPFDAAVALLAEAHGLLGDEPDKKMSAASPALRDAWGKREEGLLAFNKVHGVRTRLADVGYGRRDDTRLWYIEALSPLGAPASYRPWDLIVAGFTPHLNTAAEIDTLRAEVDRQERAAEAAAREGRLTPRDRTDAIRQDRIVAKEAARVGGTR